tara:strand:+ start:659 stop:1027 length:369 start_codon:yes stop_codon:yes gene_type:complete
MIPKEAVNSAVDNGVVFTCAMCTHFWMARGLGLDECRTLTRGPCAGPLKGMGYPYYQGALEGNLHSVCFICGGQPNGVLKTREGVMVGVCEKHREALFDFSGEVNGRPKTADSLEVEERQDG